MKFLLFLGLCALASAAQIDDCFKTCESNSKPLQCKQGCQYAHALTFSSDPPADRPTCKKACEDNLKDGEIQACESGCQAYEKEKDLFGPFHLLDMLRGLVSRVFLSSHDDVTPTQSKEDTESGPLTISRIRIFIPIDSDESQPAEPKPMQPVPLEREDTMPHHMMHNMHQHMMIVHRPVADSNSVQVEENIGCWIRHVIHAPFFLLLFIVTLSTLFILLFVQLVVLIRRRRSAGRGYQYTPLPSYAEATGIKVPLSVTDEELTKPLKEAEIEA